MKELTANRPQHKCLHIILRTDKFNIRANCFKVLAGKGDFCRFARTQFSFPFLSFRLKDEVQLFFPVFLNDKRPVRVVGANWRVNFKPACVFV